MAAWRTQVCKNRNGVEPRINPCVRDECILGRQRGKCSRGIPYPDGLLSRMCNSHSTVICFSNAKNCSSSVWGFPSLTAAFRRASADDERAASSRIRRSPSRHCFLTESSLVATMRSAKRLVLAACAPGEWLSAGMIISMSRSRRRLSSSLKNCNLYWARIRFRRGSVHVARRCGLEHVHLGDNAVSATSLSNSLLSIFLLGLLKHGVVRTTLRTCSSVEMAHEILKALLFFVDPLYSPQRASTGP